MKRKKTGCRTDTVARVIGHGCEGGRDWVVWMRCPISLGIWILGPQLVVLLEWALLEEVRHSGWVLRFPKSSCQSSLSGSCLWLEMWTVCSQLPAPVSMPACPPPQFLAVIVVDSYPSWIVAPNRLLLLEVTRPMLFYHSRRKVTKTASRITVSHMFEV